MKTTIALAATLIAMAAAGPAFPDQQSVALDAATAELVSVMDKPKRSWTPADLAQFYAAREKIDAALTSNPDSPAVKAWFTLSDTPGNWMTFGPDDSYLIGKHEPLTTDQAHHLTTFVDRMLDGQLDIYSQNPPATCLSLKALRLLKNGPASPEDEQFLNAVHLGADSIQMTLPHESLTREIARYPAFAAVVNDNAEERRKEDTISLIMGAMLFKAAASGVNLGSHEVLNGIWIDPLTIEPYPKEWIDAAAAQLATGDYSDRLATARPVFSTINAHRGKDTDALLAELCR